MRAFEEGYAGTCHLGWMQQPRLVEPAIALMEQGCSAHLPSARTVCCAVPPVFEFAMSLTFADVIRMAIPNADEGTCDHVLWGRTAYPFGNVTARTLYRAAARVRRAGEHGLRLCDFCDRVAQPERWECARCDAVLRDQAAGHHDSKGV